MRVLGRRPQTGEISQRPGALNAKARRYQAMRDPANNAAAVATALRANMKHAQSGVG